MIVDLVMLVLCALGIFALIYFYFRMKKGQKKLDNTLTDLKTRMKEDEEKAKKSDSEAIEKLKWEKDRKRASDQLYIIFHRCSLPVTVLDMYRSFRV